jgi:hypothetical protein
MFGYTGERLSRAIEREDKTARRVMIGHSAATVDTIGVVASGTLPCEGIIMSDPIGMKNAIGLAEITDYARYTYITERRKPAEAFPDKSQNPLTRTPEEHISSLGGIARELMVYGAYSKTNMSLQLLKKIVTNNLDTKVDLFFPEHTFTTTRDQQLGIKADLENTRGGDGAPVSVHLIDGAYHSYFTNYPAFGALARECL